MKLRNGNCTADAFRLPPPPATDMRKAGRFAPSPTGPLHLGSLYIALAAFLDARSQGHDWLLRIDDLDRPRTDPSAEAHILRTLESHHLHWDGPVRRQSAREGAYRTALDRLRALGLLFHCTCSRRSLRHLPVYPGTCRNSARPVNDSAIRVRVGTAAPKFADLIQGEQTTPLALDVGDFIVRRRDGIIAYQLATALDDSEPEIVRVVRGRDLLDNTTRQLFLMQLLERPQPQYAHLPLLLNSAGKKLSKQTGARAIDAARPRANLRRCLELLGLRHPPDADVPGLLDWAVENWRLARVGVNDRIVESE